MPPKKEKKPRKPRVRKEKTQTQKGKGQKQTQTQIVNVHIGSKGKPRAKSAPKSAPRAIPSNFIMMNAPPLPIPSQPTPVIEPLRGITPPTRLGMTMPEMPQYEGEGIAYAEALPYVSYTEGLAEGAKRGAAEGLKEGARRGRPPLSDEQKAARDEAKKAAKDLERTEKTRIHNEKVLNAQRERFNALQAKDAAGEKLTPKEKAFLVSIIEGKQGGGL